MTEEKSVLKKDSYLYGSFNYALLVSPLKLACLQQEFDLAEQLLRYGARPNFECPVDLGTIHINVAMGNLEFLRIIAAYETNFDQPAGIEKETPLMLAAEKDHCEIIKYLFTKEVDVRATDHSGATPLLISVLNGKIEASSLLLKKGSDPNHQDCKGKSPLMYAAQYNHPQLINLLLSNGADLELVSKKGKTALHYACVNRSIEAVKVLLLRGSNIFALDCRGQSPWAIAKSSFDDTLILLLTKAQS